MKISRAGTRTLLNKSVGGEVVRGENQKSNVEIGRPHGRRHIMRTKVSKLTTKKAKSPTSMCPRDQAESWHCLNLTNQ